MSVLRRSALVDACGLYLHIPFCASKCRYCDFLSFPGGHDDWKARYVEALCVEISVRIDADWQHPYSIFIGGGTPTSLSLGGMDTLLCQLRKRLGASPVAEFTVEMNPSSSQKDMLALLRSHGVNRLSVGVQSMDDQVLRQLGRCHQRDDVHQAIREAKDAGFSDFNLDLIYGLPGQTREMWRDTLEAAVSLEPTHLSLYQLQVEDGTALARDLSMGKLPPVDDDVAADMWDYNLAVLPGMGYHQYEISNFAKTGYACEHNQLYWRQENYLGLGLGAVSWVRPERMTNTAALETYCGYWLNEEEPPQQIEHVNEMNQMRECIMMAMRMNDGLAHAHFHALFGVTLDSVFGPALKESLQDGSMERNETHWRLTDKGRRLANIVLARFF